MFAIWVGRGRSLDKVNPVNAMGGFEIRRRLINMGVFKAIDPFEPGGVKT
jgi:hypothetical protein